MKLPVAAAAALALAGCGGLVAGPSDAATDAPNGSRGYNVAYVDHEQLYLWHSGQAALLASFYGYTPTFIRGGQSVATLAQDHSNTVELVSLDGGATTISLPQSVVVARPRSDGQRYVVEVDGASCLMSFDVATNSLTTTPICDAGDALYGPDDRTLVYVQRSQAGAAIVVSAEDGTERDVLVTATATQILQDPCFSFDGTQVAFARNNGDAPTDLVVFDRPSRTMRTVTTVDTWAYSPRFTPDGKTILMVVTAAPFEVDAISVATGEASVVIPKMDEPQTPFVVRSPYTISVGPLP